MLFPLFQALKISPYTMPMANATGQLEIINVPVDVYYL